MIQKNNNIMYFGTEKEANIFGALISAEYSSKKDFLSSINNPLNEFFKAAYLIGYEQAKTDLQENKKQDQELK